MEHLVLPAYDPEAGCLHHVIHHMMKCGTSAVPAQGGYGNGPVRYPWTTGAYVATRVSTGAEASGSIRAM